MTWKLGACLHQKIGVKKRCLSSCSVFWMLYGLTRHAILSANSPLAIDQSHANPACKRVFFSLNQSVVCFLSPNDGAPDRLVSIWTFSESMAVLWPLKKERGWEHMSDCSSAHEAPWTGSLLPRLRPHKLQVFLCSETSSMSLDLIFSAIHTVRYVPLLCVSCKAQLDIFLFNFVMLCWMADGCCQSPLAFIIFGRGP